MKKLELKITPEEYFYKLVYRKLEEYLKLSNNKLWGKKS